MHKFAIHIACPFKWQFIFYHALCSVVTNNIGDCV